MKSQKKKNNEISKIKIKISKKKMKSKKIQNSKILELNQCQCHTMSGSDNFRM